MLFCGKGLMLCVCVDFCGFEVNGVLSRIPGCCVGVVMILSVVLCGFVVV